MDILIVGSEENVKECRVKFGDGHLYQRLDVTEVRKYLKAGSIVFDFEPRNVSMYAEMDVIVFLNSVKTTLATLTSGKQQKGVVIGFSGLPTFLNREFLECTVLNDESKTALEKVCGQLGTKFKIVEDKVGMVTPRIISMIINEAYFAIEGEVASKGDIDLAMKLGTNYPFGPFEWSEKIGLKNIYELLRAAHADTNDDRYKVSSKLEQEAMS